MYHKIFDGTVPAGTTVADPTICHLYDRYTHHALEYAISGDGTAKIHIKSSISGENFIPQGYAAKGLTKASGPDGDGIGLVELKLRAAEFITFSVEETGESDEVTVVAYLVQK